MCVDLSKAKPGMVAKLRCGGEAVIASTRQPNEIYFEGYYAEQGLNSRWYDDGRYIFDGPHPFDIIELIEPEFDWKDVKPGMAFKSDNYGLCWYIGPMFVKPGQVVMTKDITSAWSDDIFTTTHKYLTRAPEHDIEVK